MSGSDLPELGSKISLISKADIRYEGRLYTVDPTECTIALSSVRSFGTEDRETQFQIAPQSQIYDYILFRGTDIKDIRVVNKGIQHPNDPAIMQVHLPNGQHLMPPFPLQSMNQSMGGYGNPFGTMGGLGAMGSSTATATGLAPGSFMLNKPKPSELNDAIPQDLSLSALNNSSTAAPPNAPSTSAAEHKDLVSVLDFLAGASRSATPVSLASRQSPLSETEARMAQQINNGGNRDKRQNQQKGGNNNNTNNNANNSSTSGGGGGGGNGGGGNGSNNGGYFQKGRRDYGRVDNHNSNYNNHDNRNHYNNQRNQNRNNQNNRGWTMHRGSNNNARNRGRGHSTSQFCNQLMGNINSYTMSTSTRLKYQLEFDFEQANNKFEELRSQLSKLKVGDDPKTEQINGETDKKDDSGNETGAGEHEPEDEEIVVGYDKTKSFFDNISCETAQDRKRSKNDWRQERKLNTETFGVFSARRGGYRGRGGYYNRNMNNYGGYNRGYRGNYNNRNRNNNRVQQFGGPLAPKKHQNTEQPQTQSQNVKTEENSTEAQLTTVSDGQ